MSAVPLRLALADDQALVRSGLKALLSGFANLQVVLEAADGEALLAGLADARVDVILSDIRMPGRDGFDVVRALRERGDATPVVLLTTFDDDARAGSLAKAEAVLRAVQEGLTNAVRHSQAQNLWVVLRREAGALRLDIRDDGRGSGDLRAGNGLCGMRERLESVGGGLDIRRTDTGGVHLHAWLPA